jgi:hypothetical protein
VERVIKRKEKKREKKEKEKSAGLLNGYGIF